MYKHTLTQQAKELLFIVLYYVRFPMAREVFNYLNNRRQLRIKLFDMFDAEIRAHYSSERRSMEEKKRTLKTWERIGRNWEDSNYWSG